MAHQVGMYQRLGLLCLLVTLCGCPASRQTSLDVVTLGKAVGLRAPYANLNFLEAQPQQVFFRLLDSLEKRGAQILVADSQSGLIGWCDAGITFVAMPTQLPQQPASATAGLIPRLAMWHGIVYGTARIRPANEGTWLHLHTVGWEPGSTKGVFSDGSYERDLFGAVATAGGRGDPKWRLPGDMEGLSTSAVRGGSDPADPHARACFPHFRSLSHISARTIRDKGLSTVYPVSLSELRAATLDVISQYSAIVSASVAEGVIVFVQGITLPKELSGKELQQVNVLLALSTEPRGPDGSTVYIAVLSDQELAVTSVLDLRKKVEKEVLEEIRKAPTELAAALVVDRLFDHLTTQMFYKDRWQGKFTRRHSDTEERK